MKQSIRENLLITMGARAAYMECAGRIRLPAGVLGEENLAEFVVETYDRYMEADIRENFDHFIETALIEKYGIEVPTNGGLDIEKRGEFQVSITQPIEN